MDLSPQVREPHTHQVPRLVARGFSQVPGIYYHEAHLYAPVVRLESSWVDDETGVGSRHQLNRAATMFNRRYGISGGGKLP